MSLRTLRVQSKVDQRDHDIRADHFLKEKEQCKVRPADSKKMQKSGRRVKKLEDLGELAKKWY